MNYMIHHASLMVADTEKALVFYQDVLGFRLAQRPVMAFNGAWLVAGSAQVHLLELPNPDPIEHRPEHAGRDRHVAFYVDKLSSIQSALDEAGIDFTLSLSGRKALFCRDPDANGLEFIEIS